MCNKTLFLDRDGIINVDHGYVYQQEKFEFINGIFELCQHASNLGYQIIVITNQAGIARGYYTESDFLALTDWMKAEFKKHDVNITDVFFCPHHPTNGVNAFKMHCDCRKPAPGLILKAQKKHDINLEQSIFIGDKVSDMQAAKNAGVVMRILVASNYDDDPLIAANRVASIQAAIEYII